MRLTMDQNGSKRTAEFNWSKNKDAFDLVSEYRRIADQAILLFDISVARETQPLNGPKLMEETRSATQTQRTCRPKTTSAYSARHYQRRTPSAHRPQPRRAVDQDDREGKVKMSDSWKRAMRRAEGEQLTYTAFLLHLTP